MMLLAAIAALSLSDARAGTESQGSSVFAVKGYRLGMTLAQLKQVPFEGFGPGKAELVELDHVQRMQLIPRFPSLKGAVSRVFGDFSDPNDINIYLLELENRGISCFGYKASGENRSARISFAAQPVVAKFLMVYDGHDWLLYKIVMRRDDDDSRLSNYRADKTVRAPFQEALLKKYGTAVIGTDGTLMWKRGNIRILSDGGSVVTFEDGSLKWLIPPKPKAPEPEKIDVDKAVKDM